MGRKKKRNVNTEQLLAAQVLTIESETDKDFGTGSEIDKDFSVEPLPEVDKDFSREPMPEEPEVIMPIEEPYKVYAKHQDSLVTEIYSTCFQDYAEGDILVKEGFGDEFIHVGYYQILDENMCHNYRIGKGTKEIKHPVLNEDGSHAYDKVPREVEYQEEVQKIDEAGNPVTEDKEIDTMVEQKVPVMADCGHQETDDCGEFVYETILVPGKEIIQVPVMETVTKTKIVYDKVYKYTIEYVEIDVIVEATPEQKAEELASMPPAPPTPVQMLENDVQFLQEDSNLLFQAIEETNEAAVFNTEDIAFVVSAIFELDEKLASLSGGQSISKLSDKLITGKEVSLVAELWARWIITNRRTFDQVPKYLQEEVRALLADAGMIV